MDMQGAKLEQFNQLQQEILRLQGLGAKPCAGQPAVELGPVLNHMPGGVFPLNAVHEFISPTFPASAATQGFMAGIIGTLMQNGKPCLWIGQSDIFPPALKAFGLDPERIIFIKVSREKEALWAVEEALKCEALAAVTGEIKELDFTQSRRMQLAAEESKVTAFIHRRCPRNIRPTSCVARWQISPLPSYSIDGLPGVGFPHWRAELLKIRNGRPGHWEITWLNNSFHVVGQDIQKARLRVLKTSVA